MTKKRKRIFTEEVPYAYLHLLVVNIKMHCTSHVRVIWEILFGGYSIPRKSSGGL